MKIGAIREGRTYRVLPHAGQATRSDGAVGRGTKAVARATGKTWTDRRRRLPAAEFELLESGWDWRRELAAGEMVTLPGRSVIAEWTDADDEYRVRVAGAASRRADLLGSLAGLGMPEQVRQYGRLQSDQRGVKVSSETVAFDRDVFEGWWPRVEPMAVGGSAIELFVQALEATDAWDSMPPELRVEQIEAARDVALSQLRDGLAVTDAELEAPAHA